MLSDLVYCDSHHGPRIRGLQSVPCARPTPTVARGAGVSRRRRDHSGSSNFQEALLQGIDADGRVLDRPRDRMLPTVDLPQNRTRSPAQLAAFYLGVSRRRLLW